MFGELGEAQVGAVHHVGLAAAFSGTHRLAVTLVAQASVLGAWRHGGNKNVHKTVGTLLLKSHGQQGKERNYESGQKLCQEEG